MARAEQRHRLEGLFLGLLLDLDQELLFEVLNFGCFIRSELGADIIFESGGMH